MTSFWKESNISLFLSLRNQASTIEGNVDDVLQKLKQGEIALQEAELTIHDSAFPLQRIQNRLDEVSALYLDSDIEHLSCSL